ncbi:glycosyltransferase family 1 protein [Treponema rectale]|uniref:Glycosyltransferase family 1 protein n=1 Tax=Treponema rectale TaxID=744512 RepID=A0A840SC49_9SPIR|nr:glycosyltransferase [Treponema rectale]MBB5218414.1 glycosyltransferase involved in cell wall biosynthesis [Treponema rectale]QOS39894.1 glycosyltransferase family 1 protein [Treponema rectale]
MKEINTIGLYINDILYNTGGTESYTVKLCYTLQQIYPTAHISFISECYKKEDALSSEDFITLSNKKYGTQIDSARADFISVPANKSNKIGTILLRKRLVSISKKFDLFFYCSRGNYVFKAKKNIHIVHFPTKPIALQKKGSNPLVIWYEKQKDKAYIKAYDLFLPNSQFTEKHFKRIWQGINDEKLNTATKVCYPAVTGIEDLHLQKENIILVLSRIEKSKHLETLIDAYKSSEYLKTNYKLVIAGGLTKSLESYKSELENRADGANIEFIINAPFSKVTELYNKASIFWHCKGFEIDEDKEPELMEHFGMSTVEAMSAGCVPIVINAAGQKETASEECGYRWNTVEELVHYTEEIAQNPEKMKAMSEAAKERSKLFTMKNFTKKIKDILEKLCF